jgi:hypothetical protein
MFDMARAQFPPMLDIEHHGLALKSSTRILLVYISMTISWHQSGLDDSTLGCGPSQYIKGL